jgi:hypothetical protein
MAIMSNSVALIDSIPPCLVDVLKNVAAVNIDKPIPDGNRLF